MIDDCPDRWVRAVEATLSYALVESFRGQMAYITEAEADVQVFDCKRPKQRRFQFIVTMKDADGNVLDTQYGVVVVGRKGIQLIPKPRKTGWPG